jgi:uncharacterized membrane protein YraQ (UPF0718 family)
MRAPDEQGGTVLVMDASKKRIIAYLVVGLLIAAGMGVYLIVT